MVMPIRPLSMTRKSFIRLPGFRSSVYRCRAPIRICSASLQNYARWVQPRLHSAYAIRTAHQRAPELH